MTFRIREYHSADTDAILELWNTAKAKGYEAVYGLAEVIASCQKITRLSQFLTVAWWALRWLAPHTSRGGLFLFHV